MDAKLFGQYLKDIRNDRGYSLTELGDKIGYSNPYLSQIETGKKGIPAPKLLKKLAIGLDIPYIELLQKAGHIEEAEKEGLMKSAELYNKYRQRKHADLTDFYKANSFDIEELLSYDTLLKYRSILLSEKDKDHILTFVRDILLKKDGE